MNEVQQGNDAFDRRSPGGGDAVLVAEIPQQRSPASHASGGTTSATQPDSDRPPATSAKTSQPARPAPTDPRMWVTPAPNPGAAAYRMRLLLVDLLIVAGSVALASIGRFGLAPARLPSASLAATWSYEAVSVVVAAGWLASLAVHGCWRLEMPTTGAADFRRLVRASLSLFGAITTLDYLLDLRLARGFLLIALPVGLAAMISSRLYWRKWMRRHWARGEYLIDVVVVGGRISAAQLAQHFHRVSDCGYRVFGVCVPGGAIGERAEAGADRPGRPTIGGFQVLGDVDEVLTASVESGAAMIVVASTDGFGARQVRGLSWALEGTGIKLVLAPSMTDVAGPRIRVKLVAGIPLMQVDEPRFRGPRLAAKNVMDVVLALVAMVMLSPLMVAVAVAVKVGDGGPVFFRQERVGLSGRTFRMWKFRSMSVDAEDRLGDLRPLSEGNDMLFKMRQDPRVTRVGRVLRRFSLDELPQLINVLQRQMSLVGPRPPLRSEVALYDQTVQRRLLVRPGITGLWQVSGRSDLSWEESVRLDLFYVENWSPTTDLVIMAQTARAMLSRRGAY